MNEPPQAELRGSIGARHTWHPDRGTGGAFLNDGICGVVRGISNERTSGHGLVPRRCVLLTRAAALRAGWVVHVPQVGQLRWIGQHLIPQLALCN